MTKKLFFILTIFIINASSQNNTLKNKILIKEDNYSPVITIENYLIEKSIEQDEECTVGVAAGSATTDGRPLVWKTRDNSSSPDNEVYYNTSYPIKFVSVVTAGATSSWMGVNEYGFAIINSNSDDLDDGTTTELSNGTFMRYALGICATVSDFEYLLDSTNVTGRQTHANFGVIDSTGAALIYETSGHQYWKFDANDSTQAPKGYILRTNFAVNGGGTGGIERYRRTVDLIADFYAGDTLNYRSILRHQMRDFSDYNSNPLSIPYPYQWSSGDPFGYIDCYVSICRSITVSASVIQGILPGEPANLSTMWSMLGQTSTSITVPYWPVGPTPSVSNGSPTAPLCNVANQIRSKLFDYVAGEHFINTYKLRDGLGGGIWQQTFTTEDSVLFEAEAVLNSWRVANPLISEMLSTEAAFANYAHTKLKQVYSVVANIQPDNNYSNNPGRFHLEQNYPNPFNPETTIEFEIEKPAYITLKIYDLAGREIETLLSEALKAGKYSQSWTINREKTIASGIYFYQIRAESPESGEVYSQNTKKMFVLK